MLITSSSLVQASLLSKVSTKQRVYCWVMTNAEDLLFSSPLSLQCDWKLTFMFSLRRLTRLGLDDVVLFYRTREVEHSVTDEKRRFTSLKQGHLNIGKRWCNYWKCISIRQMDRRARLYRRRRQRDEKCEWTLQPFRSVTRESSRVESNVNWLNWRKKEKLAEWSNDSPSGRNLMTNECLFNSFIQLPSDLMSEW